MWRARYGGGNGVRFSFSVLMELFLDASGWPVMLLTSTFSSGEFQGRGNEQVHVLPPFLAIGKDSDAGRDWGQEEKGMTEDEMAGWHHRLDGRESE